ncbi:MAG: transporter substrate-binding domain-containing protein, partial [Alphaproteobacteria bacterium]
DTLLPALASGEADAVIASHAITAANRKNMQFTDPYYRIPARFVVRSDSTTTKFSPQALADKRIGVVKGTAHEAYLRAFFSAAAIVTFKSDINARSALRFGKIEALFGDGVNLMFWLNGASSRRCCVFRGGAYTESRFFSEGVGIAVANGNDQLAALLSQGLTLARENGDYEELLLRYFPMSLY